MPGHSPTGDTVVDASDRFRRRAITVVPENDGIAAGRHARILSRQMVNAIVTARWELRKGHRQRAVFSMTEARMARKAFHRMLRRWSHLPWFRRGYEGGPEDAA